MAEIVNLNKARKAQAKRMQKEQAAANRISFGQSKAAKDGAKKDASRATRLLDGKKLD